MSIGTHASLGANTTNVQASGQAQCAQGAETAAKTDWASMDLATIQKAVTDNKNPETNQPLTDDDKKSIQDRATNIAQNGDSRAEKTLAKVLLKELGAETAEKTEKADSDEDKTEKNDKKSNDKIK